MKYGVRKPSVKKSISARTKGRYTRVIKKSTNPLYNKKGIGWANNPSKAAYNKIYHKATFRAVKLPDGNIKYTNGQEFIEKHEYDNIQQCDETQKTVKNTIGCLAIIMIIPCIPIFLLLFWLMWRSIAGMFGIFI